MWCCWNLIVSFRFVSFSFVYSFDWISSNWCRWFSILKIWTLDKTNAINKNKTVHLNSASFDSIQSSTLQRINLKINKIWPNQMEFQSKHSENNNQTEPNQNETKQNASRDTINFRYLPCGQIERWHRRLADALIR